MELVEETVSTNFLKSLQKSEDIYFFKFLFL